MSYYYSFTLYSFCLLDRLHLRVLLVVSLSLFEELMPHHLLVVVLFFEMLSLRRCLLISLSSAH